MSVTQAKGKSQLKANAVQTSTTTKAITNEEILAAMRKGFRAGRVPHGHPEFCGTFELFDWFEAFTKGVEYERPDLKEFCGIILGFTSNDRDINIDTSSALELIEQYVNHGITVGDDGVIVHHEVLA